MKKELVKYIIFVECVIAVTILLNAVVIINANVPSASMEKTIMTGDKLIGNRLAYRFSEPERGDIVIFKDTSNSYKLLVKRVIALPGEVVEVREGQVYINLAPVPLDEPYAHAVSFMDFGPYTVPQNSYFMLGDNRNKSNDSRYWTEPFVEKKDIKGKVVLRYWDKLTFY